MPVWIEYFTDVKVLSDKASQLEDGTPAREVEWEGVLKNGPKENEFALMTKKDMAWVAILLGAREGKLGEDLKRYCLFPRISARQGRAGEGAPGCPGVS